MPIALIQSAIKDVRTVNNTTLAFTSNLTAGNLIIFPIVTFQSVAGTTITTPTDTLGHTYLPVAAQQNNGTNTVHLRSWYVPNCIAGADTATADISGTGTGEITCHLSEWSGINLSSPLSGTPVTAGPVATNNPSTGAMTPADSGSLLIGVLNAGGTAVTITPAAGWTQVNEYEGGNSSVTLSVIYKIQGIATGEAASWTLSASPTCMSHLMAFKPAIGAAGGVVFGGLALRGYGR